MTIMPGVDWRPSPNFSSPVRRPPRGIVLHIAQGSYDGTVGWQANAAAQVSSYFVNGRDGRLAQCVDLDHKAWTQGTGNEAWIGIENEGSVPDALTDAQINNIARIWAWMHSIWPTMKIQVTDDPVNGEGIGWHGMGASIGWGHPDCPGEAIKAQRPLIVARTLALLGGAAPTPQPSAPTEETVVFYLPAKPGDNAFRPRGVSVINGTLFVWNCTTNPFKQGTLTPFGNGHVLTNLGLGANEKLIGCTNEAPSGTVHNDGTIELLTDLPGGGQPRHVLDPA